MSIWIKESFINRTRGGIFGETEPFEAWTDDLGKLYRSFVKEYGRCISKVYVDQKQGPPKAVGWVFLKRMKYEDSRSNTPEDYYIREVWVSVVSGPLVRKVEHPAYVSI